ncbi:MAG: sensor histidine kinase [Acidimicrobiales bacterium]
MTLRTRLLLVLVGIVAAGLVITDVVTYTQLRSFLLARVDPQLQVASFSMTRALYAENGLGPSLNFVPRSGTIPEVPSGATAARHASFPRPFPTGSFPRDARDASGLEPAGTFGELIGPKGVRVGKSVSVIYSGTSPPAPLLVAAQLLADEDSQPFDVPSEDHGSLSYRVMVRTLGDQHHLSVVVAIPLSDVTDTLGRLLWVELLVSLIVVAGLGGLSWWVVRRDLRPLEDMAATAGEIAGGELGRRVTPAEDRTEVGRLGLALNAMLGNIEAAFAARAASEDRLRRFLADASHELRTPLTSIRGYAEIFDLGAAERPADLATSMRHIREEAQRMNILVDDLLLLARLDQERPLEIRDTDIAAVLDKAVSSMRLVAPTHPLTLLSPTDLVAPCDPGRLRQLVDNLVTNAISHSPEGAPVEVRASRDAGTLRIEVRDHGPGVPAAERGRIFEPFYRADFARARSEGGAGLGLAIVAAIARAHGGRVGVEDTPGGGASFWFEFPAARPPGPPSGRRAADVPGPGPEPSENQQVHQSPGTARTG